MRRKSIAIILLVLTCMSGAASAAPLAAPSEKATIDLRSIDILEFFKILSVKMGVTILPGKNISGRLNILLNNLTYEDALDLIVVSQGLACERQGNIINVMDSAEYEKLYGKKYNEKRKFRAIKLNYAKPSTVFSTINQVKSDIGKIILDESSATIFVLDTPERLGIIESAVKELDQALETEIFELQYASPEEIKSHVEGLLTKGAGEAIIDGRSKKIIVSDLPDKLKRIAGIIKELDVEPYQVLIECDIAEINFKDERQREINWEVIFENLKKMDLKGTFPVSPSWTPSQAMSTASQAVNVGTLSRDHYTAALKFLETLGDTKIHSHPELLVVNNQEGSIMVGSREAYVIQTLSQAAGSTISAEDIQFIDVGIKLNVAPSINRNGVITMKIKPQVSSVRETITTTLGSRVPIVDTSEAETFVKVKDGAMVMVAGLSKYDKRDDTSGIPGLSRLPLIDIGSGSGAQLRKKTEFVVFLTPHIVKGGSNAVLNTWKKPAPIELQDKLKGMKIVESY